MTVQLFTYNHFEIT